MPETFRVGLLGHGTVGSALHRLIEEHCHRHTEDAPRWTIDPDTFRTTYTAHIRDLDAFDRGYGHG